MSDRKTIAVIGAGIVGVSTGIWLQREGHDVILIEREAEAGEGTSFGNGGVLAASGVVPVTVPGLMAKAPKMLFSPNEPLFLKWGYLPRLAPWLMRYLGHGNVADVRRIASALHNVVGDSYEEHRALSAGTGAERYLLPGDYVFLYRDRAHYEGDAFGWGLRRDLGYTWDEMDRDDLMRYDPSFSAAAGFAVRLGDHGRVSDPGAYVKALAKHAVDQGARMIRATVTDFVRESGRVKGVRAGGETIACDAAVLATGAWSKTLGEKLGLSIPLETERGYHLELWEPSAMPRSPVMVASGKFVMTPMDGRLRLAGIVEFGGLEAPASAAPIRLLKRQLAEILPDLTWKEEREWLGHRPAPADSIPAIGEVPGAPGVYLGFGHHHIGLTGGPKTGEMLARLIAGKISNVDLEPYSPSRFTK